MSRSLPTIIFITLFITLSNATKLYYKCFLNKGDTDNESIIQLGRYHYTSKNENLSTFETKVTDMVKLSVLNGNKHEHFIQVKFDADYCNYISYKPSASTPAITVVKGGGGIVKGLYSKFTNFEFFVDLKNGDDGHKFNNLKELKLSDLLLSNKSEYYNGALPYFEFTDKDKTIKRATCEIFEATEDGRIKETTSVNQTSEVNPADDLKTNEVNLNDGVFDHGEQQNYPSDMEDKNSLNMNNLLLM